jgi:hypothetical protein
MRKLTNIKVTLPFITFLAGAALAGTGLRATSGPRAGIAPVTPPTVPYFYYDLEQNHHHGRDVQGQLRLVATPVRYSKQGLLVRVEVWNPSIEAKLVHPIYPKVYRLLFRDAAGALVKVYSLPPGCLAIQNETDFARLDYGNCLATNYMLPTFYNRVGRRDLECRVEIGTVYNLDRKGGRATFHLASGWVKVPPS